VKWLIEQQINGVENMLYMQSTCTSDGRYTLTVTFKVGTDLDFAQILVQNRVAAAMSQLPQSVQQQGVADAKDAIEHGVKDRGVGLMPGQGAPFGGEGLLEEQDGADEGGDGEDGGGDGHELQAQVAADEAADEGAEDESQAEENIIAKLIRQKGWYLTILLVLLGGLALNLTPCVYPMIPLTVAYFGTRNEDGPYRMFARAVAYVLGISVTYTALGVTAAMTGRLFGSALQSPYILIGISILLVTLSFSMFGLYEIQAPSWLLNRIGGSTATGLAGAFAMGLVFGVVAAAYAGHGGNVGQAGAALGFGSGLWRRRGSRGRGRDAAGNN